ARREVIIAQFVEHRLDPPKPLLILFGRRVLADAAAEAPLKGLVDLPLDTVEADAGPEKYTRADLLVPRRADRRRVARVAGVASVGDVVTRHLNRRLVHSQGGLADVERADETHFTQLLPSHRSVTTPAGRRISCKAPPSRLRPRAGERPCSDARAPRRRVGRRRRCGG